MTDGLQGEFGDRRVFDTPISEAGIAGAAVGLAFAGWRSVVEMQFDAFSYPALEQIIDHVAKMRDAHAGPGRHADHDPHPLVRRHQGQGAPRREPGDLLRPHGRAEGGGVPSSALDAYTAAAPRDRRPRPGDRAGAEGAVLGEGGGRAQRPTVPASATAASLREGDAVRWSALRRDGGARAARPPTRSRPSGIERARRRPPIAVPARRRPARGGAREETGRVVVVHEAPRTLGLGAEVAARVMELAFDSPRGAGRARDRLGRAVPAGRPRAAATCRASTGSRRPSDGR